MTSIEQLKFPFAAEIGIHVAIFESDAQTIINQLLCRRSSSQVW